MTQTTTQTTDGQGAKPPLLEVSGLRKYFPIKKGFLKREVGNIRAVDDVTFSISEGETLGLVGGERMREDDDFPVHFEGGRSHRRRDQFPLGRR